MIKLRPHHVLCMRFFEGRGYSPAFTGHAGRIQKALLREGVFTVTAGADDICRACPHNSGACAFAEKTERYDALAARALQLEHGGVYDFNALQGSIGGAAVAAICADCEWAELCSAKL